MKTIFKLDMKYAASQMFYWGAYCAMTGFASVYLLDRRFSNSAIGMVLALCNVLAVILQPVLAAYIDKNPNIELRSVILVITAGAMILSGALYIFPDNKVLVFILTVAVYSLIIAAMPLMNALAFVFEKYGIKINYGFARGMGSVAYALTSMILGYIVEYFMPGVLPLFYILLCVLLYAVVRLFVLPENGEYVSAEAEPGHREENQQLSMAEFCAKYKRFIAFLFGFIFIYFAHTIINYFLIQIVTDIGGTSSDMGNAVFLAALMELPAMLCFSRISQKISCGTLIKFSILMFLLKHMIAYLAFNMIMIYISQAIQLLAYAIFIPASVYYVNQKIAVADRVKGQSMVTMAMTIAGIFASLIGGMLIDSIGIHQVLMVGVVVSLIGAVIVCITVEK